MAVGGAGYRVAAQPGGAARAFGSHQGATALKDLYNQATDEHNKALAEIREQAKLVKSEGDNYGAAALEFAVGYHKAALAWLKSAPTR